MCIRDRAYHVQRLDNYLDHGWFLIDADLVAGEPAAGGDDRFVYAPVTALLAHAVNVLVGSESWGVVGQTPTAIGVRHLVIASFGLVAALASAAMTRLLTQSWRWGLVAGALLLSMPAWTGHAMFNIKDVPVAAGYTLATLGAMLLVRGHQQDRRDRRLLALGASTTLVGSLLAIGTRPGIWPGVAFALGLGVLSMVLRRRWRDAGTLLGIAAAESAVAWLLLAAVHPAGFAGLDWVLGSVSSSNSFAGRGSPLYVPLMVLVEVPTVTLLLVLALSLIHI